MSSLKTAFVTGYTGSVGKAVVQELSQSQRFDKVVLIGRRKVEFDDPAIQAMEQRQVDMEQLEQLAEVFAGFDVGFCCLGTTRADAGSAAAFRRIDYDYVHQIALNAKQGGTKHFHYVSSAGADKSSSFLYPKTKGQIEEALTNILFQRLSIYRPRFLQRQERARLGEKLIGILTKPIAYLKPEMVTTPCPLLAKCMVNNCDQPAAKATEIIDNHGIYRIAAATTSIPNQSSATATSFIPNESSADQ